MKNEKIKIIKLNSPSEQAIENFHRLFYDLILKDNIKEEKLAKPQE